jgi:hypothetical protein
MKSEQLNSWGDWVTADNLNQAIADDCETVPLQSTVGLFTLDNAMQNIAL